MKSELVPMDCCDVETEESMFVAECSKIGEESVVTENRIRNLIALWEKLLKADEASDFGNVDKCLESILICTAKLIFNVEYSQPKKVSPNCKSDLKTAIENCGVKFSDSEKRKNICVGISSLVCNPWTSDEFKKVYGGLKANRAKLRIPNEDIDALWNTEGWIFLETRGDYFVRIGNLATGPFCTSLNILVQKGRKFYESNNIVAKGSDVYDPFKFSYSKYLEYLEVYTIMASLGFFDAQSITSWNSRTILEVINGLEKQAQNPNGERVFSKLKCWKDASEAALYLTKVATWKTLKSEEDEMAHEYFTEWLRLVESSSEDKYSALVEILEKFDEITSTANVYRVANAAVEYFGKTEFITLKYVEIYVRGMTKDMNAIEDIKSTDLESTNKDKMRLLERKLSRCYVQLARFFKEHPKTSKECLLTAFSLNPCAKLFECLFPKSEFKKEINSVKDEDDDFLSSELADISVVKFDVDTSTEEDLQLPSELCDDLETVIHNPRYKGLFRWNSNAELERLCRKLLIEEGLDGIENKKLEYVNLDYEKYKDLPSQYDPEDDGIEKGYRKGEWRTRKRYNSKIINRTGILKKAARKVKDALRIKNNSDSSIEKVKGSRKKLAVAIGTVRKRGRPLKHKEDSSAVNTAYKTKQFAKFKSIRLENELKCNQGQVREVHNYQLSKSPWFPSYSQTDHRLSYGELFIKFVRNFNLESKERMQGRNIEIENQLISSTPQTIPFPSVFQQYGGGDQSMDTRSHQGSEAYQNSALRHNIEHNGGGNEDSRFFLPAGFTSSSYSNNPQPNSSASTVHGASTNDQSSLYNIDIGQSSQLNYQSQLAASAADQQTLLLDMIKRMQAANKQKLTKKLISQRCRQQYPLEVTSVEAKKDMSKPTSNTNQKIKRLAKPVTSKITKNSYNEGFSHISEHEATQMESAVVFGAAMDSQFHISQADVVNSIVGFGFDVKPDCESEGTKSSRNDNGCETSTQTASTDSCFNNPTPIENITDEVASVRIPEVVMPDCAFQIMSMYKKGDDPTKQIKSEVPASVQNTGRKMFDQPKLLTPKLEREEVIRPEGKYLAFSNTGERSKTVSAFQLPNRETKPTSQPIHHPEENRPKIIINKCYPGAKKGRRLVIKSTPPMDAYATASKAPTSRGASSTHVSVSSQLAVTISSKPETIVSSVSNDSENSEGRERGEMHSRFQVPQNNPILNQNPSDHHNLDREAKLDEAASFNDSKTGNYGVKCNTFIVNTVGTVSKAAPEVLQPSVGLKECVLIHSPNPVAGENESISSELKNHVDEPDNLKTLESLEGLKPSEFVDHNSPCSRSSEASPVQTSSADDRAGEKEASATGAQLHTVLTDINPLKCSSTKKSFTVNLKLHQQPLLLLCSSRIANKEIKVEPLEIKMIDKDLSNPLVKSNTNSCLDSNSRSSNSGTNNDFMLMLSCKSVGNPDYAKEKNNFDGSRKLDKVLSETNQIPGLENSESGLKSEASKNQDVANENQPIPNVVYPHMEFAPSPEEVDVDACDPLSTDGYCVGDLQHISEIKPEITDEQVCDVQLNKSSHEDSRNQISSESSCLITTNNCVNITPTPGQEMHRISTVSDVSPLFEQGTNIPNGLSTPLRSDTHLKEVMIAENELNTEIEECLHDVISSVENLENMHNNLITIHPDRAILKLKTEREISESNDEKSIGCLHNKTSTVFINSTNKSNFISTTTSLPLFCEIRDEKHAVQACNETENASINDQSNVCTDKLPKQELVDNLKWESPEVRLIDAPVATSSKAEVIISNLSAPASDNSEIIDSCSAEVRGSKAEELDSEKIESASQIFNRGITFESESNYPSDATTDVDDEPQTATLKNERLRSVTPVHEVEELYDKIQQKSRRKNKRPYEDEEDKIKIAPSVVKHFKEHGGSLRQIFHCVLRVQKLSDDQIPPSSRNVIPVKRSSRLKDRKLLTVKAIQTAYQSNASKEDDSSRSESRESSPEIEILQEFGIIRPNSPSITNGVLSSKTEMKRDRSMPQNSSKRANLFRGYKTRSSRKENNTTQQNLDSADKSEHLVNSEPLVDANNVVTKSQRMKSLFKRKRRSTNSTNRNRRNKMKKLKTTNVRNNTCSEASDDQSSTSSGVEDDSSYSSSSRGEDTELLNATDTTKLSERENVNDVAYPHMQFAPSPEEVVVDACDPLSTDGYCVGDLQHISPLNVEHIILDSETSSEPHDEDYDTLVNGKRVTSVQTSDFLHVQTSDDLTKPEANCMQLREEGHTSLETKSDASVMSQNVWTTVDSLAQKSNDNKEDPEVQILEDSETLNISDTLRKPGVQAPSHSITSEINDQLVNDKEEEDEQILANTDTDTTLLNISDVQETPVVEINNEFVESKAITIPIQQDQPQILDDFVAPNSGSSSQVDTRDVKERWELSSPNMNVNGSEGDFISVVIPDQNPEHSHTSLTTVFSESDLKLVTVIPDDVTCENSANETCVVTTGNAILISGEVFHPSNTNLSSAVNQSVEQESTEPITSESVGVTQNVTHQFGGKNNIQPSHILVSTENVQPESGLTESKKENDDVVSLSSHEPISATNLIHHTDIESNDSSEETVVLINSTQSNLANPPFVVKKLDYSPLTEVVTLVEETDARSVSLDEKSIVFDVDQGKDSTSCSEYDCLIVNMSPKNDGTHHLEPDTKSSLSVQLKEEGPQSDNQFDENSSFLSLQLNVSHDASHEFMRTETEDATVIETNQNAQAHELSVPDTINQEVVETGESQAMNDDSSVTSEVLENSEEPRAIEFTSTSQNFTNTIGLLVSGVNNDSREEIIHYVTIDPSDGHEQSVGAIIVCVDDANDVQVAGTSNCAKDNMESNEYVAVDEELKLKLTSSNENKHYYSSASHAFTETTTAASPSRDIPDIQEFDDDHLNSDCNDLKDIKILHNFEEIHSSHVVTDSRPTSPTNMNEDDGFMQDARENPRESGQIELPDNVAQDLQQTLEILRPVTPMDMSVNDTDQTESPVIPELHPMDSEYETVMHSSDSDEEPPVLELQVQIID